MSMLHRVPAIAVVAFALTFANQIFSADSPCTLPGVHVISDPTGDQQDPYSPAPDPPGYDSRTQDIQGVYFAELAQNPGKITFTMKVQDLTTVPANGSWRIRFTSIDGNTYFVSMDTDQNSQATFSYGTYAVTQGQGNYTSSGSADSGTFSADGTITITNSNSKMGSPVVGSTLTDVLGETDLLIGTQQVGGLLATVDDTSNATPANPSYTLVGNTFCGTGGGGGSRIATYTHGGITFSPNSPLKAPTAHQDGEPSSRIDAQGNFYIMPIQGVPAGVNLFYFDLRSSSSGFDPNMRVPVYRGQPDSPFSSNGVGSLSAGALGGGDIDLALGFDNYSGVVSPSEHSEAVPAMAYASLTAANVTVGHSLDRGQTFTFNGAGNVLAGVPINDRQWMGFVGNNNVFLVYRNFAEGIAFVQQSTDGGLNYGPALPPGGISFPQTGALDVDQTTGVVYVSSNDGHVAVGDPANNVVPGTTGPGNAPTSYTVVQAVPAGVNTANIFFPIRVATVNHTVYGVYSDASNIYLVSSADKGQTWTAPVRVNDTSDPDETINLMPWLATGPVAGSVGVVWYGSDNSANNDNANWRVFFAQSFNADSNTPAFRIVQASDHSNHASNISLSGLVLTGGPNRNLIDYFQVNFDPSGAAAIGYTDDHNDFRGHSYVTRQISGPSINGTGDLPTQQEGTSLPAQPFAVPGTVGALGAPPPQPMQPGPNGEQVTDFAQDQDSGLLGVAPANNPVDIVSIKYQSQNTNQGPYITAAMTVSDLTTTPSSCVWRMYFAANAPEMGVIGPIGNQFSRGLPDRGDQFWVDAETSAQGAITFNWGTTIRNSDGSSTDTKRGTADAGAFNRLVKQISVRVSAAKLNTYLNSVGHASIGVGSTFCGLKGHAFVTDPAGENIALQDITRGGTEFTITSSP